MLNQEFPLNVTSGTLRSILIWYNLFLAYTVPEVDADQGSDHNSKSHNASRLIYGTLFSIIIDSSFNFCIKPCVCDFMCIHPASPILPIFLRFT